MRVKANKAVMFYEMGGETRLINQSSLGDNYTRDWIHRLAVAGNPPLFIADRYLGDSIHSLASCVIVTDETAIRASAYASGIKVL